MLKFINLITITNYYAREDSKMYKNYRWVSIEILALSSLKLCSIKIKLAIPIMGERKFFGIIKI